ncbi:MAG: hypothetical protein RL154_291 [Pseudomonadota bacterium]
MSALKNNDRPNTLIKEDSVYLLQHAYNPVNWLPWSAEAFLLAKTKNRPIFLSIGYSACHWCHVMEREVFENEELAKKLNEKFICIKVDKEERPDLDKHFQLIYQLMAKRAGGWPTSIFLTKNRNPFYVGTYIPPTPKHGINGFGEIIDFLYEKHSNSFDELDKRASGINDALAELNEKNPHLIDFDIKAKIKNFVEKSFDKTDGGILGEPKFPHAALLDYMLGSKDEFLVEQACFTLKKMSRGGIYDIIDGGFCRYSVDSFWIVPHFEKMLYDNGALIGTYAKAYAITKDEHFLKIAKQSTDYLLEKMQDSSGLFYSASDADSDGEEGAYFVYTYNEALEALGGDKEILKKLGFSKIGNFDGKNIVINENPQESQDIDRAINILKELRSKREYPIIDTKLLTSWNALAISGIFELAKVDGSYLKIATNLLDVIERKLIVGGELYHCKAPNKKPKIRAFLEDYSYLAKTYLDAFNTIGAQEFKQKAFAIATITKDKYFNNGVWKFSTGEFETYADVMDSSYISAIAPICEVLIAMGDIETALKSTQNCFSELRDYPAYNASVVHIVELLNER